MPDSTVRPLRDTRPAPRTSTSSLSATAGRHAILTVVTPVERSRLDAAAQGHYIALHRDSIDEVVSELRTRTVTAVVVSAACYQDRCESSMAQLVREFPTVPAIALLSATESHSTSALLALGKHGVRDCVDARDPNAWRTLRTLVSKEPGVNIEAHAVQTLREDLQGAIPATHRFFQLLFSVPPGVTTVQQLCRSVGIMPTTLMSRFFRAGIPAPKKYLAVARLVRAAALLENPGYSITQVAFLLEYSSPQSFSRHVTSLLRIGAAEFRRRFTGKTMLEHMRQTLVKPYRTQLLTFDPFSSPPQWVASRLGRVAEPAPQSAFSATRSSQ